MNIKLYRININTREKNLTPIDLWISGKQIIYIELPYDNPNDGFVEERFYNYEYDNSYKTKFKKLKLNHRFMINGIDEFDDATISNLMGYVHLNYLKKIKIDWIFKRTWIQKTENTKWLIGLVVASLIGILAIAYK